MQILSTWLPDSHKLLALAFIPLFPCSPITSLSMTFVVVLLCIIFAFVLCKGFLLLLACCLYLELPLAICKERLFCLSLSLCTFSELPFAPSKEHASGSKLIQSYRLPLSPCQFLNLLRLVFSFSIHQIVSSLGQGPGLRCMPCTCHAR